MDHPARKVNVVDQEALEDLERALGEIEALSGARGVVLRSGKSGSFIAGADIEAIGSMTDRDAVLAVIHRAHAAFNRLSALPVPTVAAIDGACLGAGTELALACDSRIASDEPRTQIGLPEVLLGISRVRRFAVAPRVVGLTALDLIPPPSA
jgi:3-hydroxyacyl-CoA dehydrogenase/enoyl-CoA hydratase/3-hydroxybutyryl-CoA epimerase